VPARDHTIRFTARDGVGLVCRVLEAEPGSPALVLLHGAASNGDRWWDFVEHSRLAGRVRLIRPDLRGHGDSAWTGVAGMARWCEDLDDLMQALALDRIVIGGHCLGANLAAHYAASRRGRCAGLVLVEPMLRPALRGRLARVGRVSGLLRLVIPLLDLVTRLGLRRRLERVDLRALDLRFRALLAEPGGTGALKGRYASPRHDLRSVHPGQYLNNLLAVLQPLPLTQLGLPTLALLSQGRFMADPQVTAAGLAQLPKVEIRELAAEHWIPTEQPEAMRRAIDDWMDALPSLYSKIE